MNTVNTYLLQCYTWHLKASMLSYTKLAKTYQWWVLITHHTVTFNLQQNIFTILKCLWDYDMIRVTPFGRIRVKILFRAYTWNVRTLKYDTSTFFPLFDSKDNYWGNTGSNNTTGRKQLETLLLLGKCSSQVQRSEVTEAFINILIFKVFTIPIRHLITWPLINK